jgi:ABC-type Fe3+/spermidine/putrescine transport system ATPase subunit
MSDRIAVFKGGRIVQVGTPQELYETPSSRFVADFVGESNFFVGVVRTSTIDLSVIELSCGSVLRTSRGSVRPTGSTATLAVRPERVRLSDARTQVGPVNRLSGVVREVVYLGQTRRTVVALDTGTEFVCVEQLGAQSSSPFAEGAPVNVGWNAADAVLVDE